VLSRRVSAIWKAALRPLTNLCMRISLPPNLLTLSGLVASLGSAYAFKSGAFRIGALALLLAGLFDSLDGEVARRTGGATTFGAFLDSTVDRYSESLVFLGIAWHYLPGLQVLIVIAALVGSYMVSYARARSEGIGYECRAGLMERPERMILLACGGLAGERYLLGFLVALAVLTHLTALQRIHHVWRQTRGALTARTNPATRTECRATSDRAQSDA
jgi:CDP-diacylglycerol--glycerol-3-phosphate 3-phosphatidyltransferase